MNSLVVQISFTVTQFIAHVKNAHSLSLNLFVIRQYVGRHGNIPPDNEIFSLIPLYSPNPRVFAATTLNWNVPFRSLDFHVQMLLQDPLNAIFHIKFRFSESFEVPFLPKKEQNHEYRKYVRQHMCYFQTLIYHFNDRTPEHLLLHILPLIPFLSLGLATEHSRVL